MIIFFLKNSFYHRSTFLAIFYHSAAPLRPLSMAFVLRGYVYIVYFSFFWLPQKWARWTGADCSSSCCDFASCQQLVPAST